MQGFVLRIGVGAPAGTEFVDLDALVDTGATYTWVPRDILDQLGVRPTETRSFLLADGREMGYPIAWVQVRIDGQKQPTIAVFGEAGSEPLLGVFTLEGFGFAADPVNRRLLPVPALLKKSRNALPKPGLERVAKHKIDPASEASLQERLEGLFEQHLAGMRGRPMAR